MSEASKPAPLSDAAAAAACGEPEQGATEGFYMQQTMLRIKDPKATLDFYSRVLGMRLLCKLDFPEFEFSLFFMGYARAEDVPADRKERIRWAFAQPGTMEFTHNWGTESDPAFKGHHNGNSDPRGFGHIGVVVPDVTAACSRFEALGVKFVKKPSDGKMKGLAFIQDPDGYWIEVLNFKESVEANVHHTASPPS